MSDWQFENTMDRLTKGEANVNDVEHVLGPIHERLRSPQSFESRKNRCKIKWVWLGYEASGFRIDHEFK